MLAIVLGLLPWLALIAFLALRVRLVPELPPRESPGAGPPRRLTVVIPARNEAVNIERCLRSVAASDDPSFDVIVVDDRSDDDTARRAEGVGAGNARSLRVIRGAPLPDGWLGKPWACWQGAEVAEGDLLLFTDADTVHGPDLLPRARTAFDRERPDLLTVVGRQEMGSFWERLVQPQIFLTMIMRFHDVDRAMRLGRWRDAIANGQFMMFARASYDAIDGHRAVRDEVAEDLRLAQLVVRGGRRLVIRRAEDDFGTRMYRSLGGLVEGWSKNIVMGGLQTVTPRLRPLMAPASFLTGLGLWIVPPVVLALGLAGLVPDGALAWAALAVALSVGLWAYVTRRMGASAWYGLLYPLGASIGIFIFLKSWIGGRNVRWKGRSYRLKSVAETP